MPRKFSTQRHALKALQAQVENLQAELGRLKSPGAQQQSSRKGSLDLGTLQGVQRLSLRRRGSSSWANHLEKAELLDQSPRAETQRARSSGASQQALDPPSKGKTSSKGYCKVSELLFCTGSYVKGLSMALSL